MEQTEADTRRYGRYVVELRARFRIVETDEIEALSKKLREAPSVWSPEGETELWRLADSPQSGSDGLLARALLDIARQIGRLNSRVLDAAGPMEVGGIHHLSGGGALLATAMLLPVGTHLEIKLMDEHMEAPPVRALAEVVHDSGPSPARYGLAFRSIHPTDRERLIRYLYQLQRRELRKASLAES